MSRAPRPQELHGVIVLAVVGLTVLGAPLPARAQTKPGVVSPAPATDPSTEPKTKEQLEAQQHFQRAKDLYQTGSYREAIAELEQARTLDPKAKDLVFNLGIVHEKLGRFDEAIVFFRQYMELESVTAPERAKAENIIKRIEGAKREVVTPAMPSNGNGQPDPVTPPTRPEETKRGRIDAATITAAAVAVVGLGVGATFGILALSNKPASGFVTGRDGTYSELEARTNDAHTQAIVADIGLGVGLVATAVTAYLYFGRPKVAKPVDQLTGKRGLGFVGLAPAAMPIVTAGGISGGGVFLGGAFR